MLKGDTTPYQRQEALSAMKIVLTGAFEAVDKIFTRPDAKFSL